MRPALLALVREAPAAMPRLGATWRVDDRLALSCERVPDREAWVQLGIALEAIAITAAAHGTGVAITSLTPPIALRQAPCTIAPNVQRLAACFDRMASDLRPDPGRLAAHAPGRLAAAAAIHDCALTWSDAPAELHAARVAHDLQLPGVCALGEVHTAGADRDALVRGGRASCRVWLEASSLGLAFLATRPLPAAEAGHAISLTWFGFAG